MMPSDPGLEPAPFIIEITEPAPATYKKYGNLKVLLETRLCVLTLGPDCTLLTYHRLLLPTSLLVLRDHRVLRHKLHILHDRKHLPARHHLPNLHFPANRLSGNRPVGPRSHHLVRTLRPELN